MVFGWGQDPDPDPERAKQAQDRYQRALSLLDDQDRSQALEALDDAAEHGAHAHTPDGYTTRARALLKKARTLETDDPDAAQSAYQDAREAALQATTQQAALLGAEASLRLGHLHEAHEQAKHAISAYRVALDTAREIQTPTGREWAAHAALRLARAHAAHGDTNAAVDPAREAIELAQAADTSHGDRLAALASIDTGRILEDHARFAEATDALERAHALAAALPETTAAWIDTLAYAHEGRVHHDEGRRAAAKNALRSALHTANKTPDPRTHLAAAEAAWMLAEIHAERGDDEDAQQAYDTALDHATNANHGHEHAARIQLAKAHFHLLRAHADDAQHALTRAAELGDQADTPTGNQLARRASSKNVKLASGDDAPLEDPPTPGPQPPRLPKLPNETQRAPDPEPPRDADQDPEDETGDEAPMTAPEHQPPRTASDPSSDETPASPRPAPSGETRSDLIDRAETLRELALSRKDADRLQEAIQAVQQALHTDPRDPDLLHREASLKATLATWQDDAQGLQDALDTFQRAFQEHGGRVDPTTHRPGPNFFFDWGTAAYHLAKRDDDAPLYEDALERLTQGYEMTPRGARHRIAAALMARCRHGIARTRDDVTAYQAVVDEYEALEEHAPYALDTEDHAVWADALAKLADEHDDLELAQRAYQRMRRAYEDDARP